MNITTLFSLQKTHVCRYCLSHYLSSYVKRNVGLRLKLLTAAKCNASPVKPRISSNGERRHRVCRAVGTVSAAPSAPCRLRRHSYSMRWKGKINQMHELLSICTVYWFLFKSSSLAAFATSWWERRSAFARFYIKRWELCHDNHTFVKLLHSVW